MKCENRNVRIIGDVLGKFPKGKFWSIIGSGLLVRQMVATEQPEAVVPPQDTSSIVVDHIKANYPPVLLGYTRNNYCSHY